MRRFRLRPRTWIALGVVGVVAAALSVAGYAYFTSSGSGSGVGYVGTAGPVTITPSWPSGVYMYPGGTTGPNYYVTVPLTITNTSATASVSINSIGGSVATNGDCLGTWFSVSGDPINVTLAPGASTTAYNGYVWMTESNTDQNACQGTTPTVNWTTGP